MSNNTENHISDRWCITPFSTRTRKLHITSETIFINLNILLLLANITSSSIGIYLIGSSRFFKRKYCLWILYHTCINDLIFACITQTMYGFKLFLPELPCIYDIIWSFSTITLANASLSLVVTVAILRLISTKYLLPMKVILSKRRCRMISISAYLFGIIISVCMSLGAVFNDVYLIHLPAGITDILFPIIVPMIYHKAAQVTKRRRESSYCRGQMGLVGTALRRGMYGTLITYIPCRLPYFISSTYKMFHTIEFDNDSNFKLQIVHSLCFLIFCTSPVGNLALYFISDRRARNRMVAYYTCHKATIINFFGRFTNRTSAAEQ